MPVLLAAASAVEVIVMLCAYAGFIASQKIYTRTDGLGGQIMVRCLKYISPREDVWFSQIFYVNLLWKQIRRKKSNERSASLVLKTHLRVLRTADVFWQMLQNARRVTKNILTDRDEKLKSSKACMSLAELRL